MKNLFKIYLVCLIFLSTNGYSQLEDIKKLDTITSEVKIDNPSIDNPDVSANVAESRLMKKSNKLYDKFSYADAAKAYEKAYEKGNNSPELFKKLGNTYYFNADLEKAAKWYNELFALNVAVEPEYYFRYSQALKSIGNYDKANKMLLLFHKKAVADNRGKNFVNKSNYLDIIKSNSGRYTIEDAGINSKYVDYGTAIVGDKIVFTSARDTGNFAQRKHKWSNQYFTNLYASNLELGKSGKIKVVKYAKSLNSRFHESTPVFTNDGKTMYFTRNNYNEGKRGKSDNKITLLKIYQAKLMDSTWQDVKELPFNDNNYSTEHPALSEDGKTMYFASDMPGTYGQLDIWKVNINDDGSFGNPENLGPKINTEGRESFPTFTNENELYFASDGLLGLGGYDIFVSKLNKYNVFQEPINVGAPANSSDDDFAYLIDTTTRKGYLSSNRPGGKGLDDIYKFVETKRLICEQSLTGVVTDTDTKKNIFNSKITLSDDHFVKIKEMQTDANGSYSFDVNCGKTYYVKAEKEGYITKETPVTIPTINGKTTLNITLDKIVVKGDDLAIKLELNTIYFDLDKYYIRKDAALELEKIAAYLRKNTTIQVDIRSHTDCRHSHKYNQVLSERRAKSTFDWLVKNGINANRLTYKGYGETQLVNGCKDGVKCTEAEHQLNRRSEFIITKM